MMHEFGFRKRVLVLMLLLALLLAACVVGSVAPAGAGDDAGVMQTDSSDQPARVEEPAPNFTLATLDGGELALRDLRGQPVILNFWATWCGPCRLEMPHLEEAFRAHEVSGLVVLGINLTQRENDRGDIQPFVDEFGLTFPILLDEAGEVADLYRVRGQPASVFIDSKGIVQMVWQGPVTGDFIDEQVVGLVE